jgi:hypothetical protein
LHVLLGCYIEQQWIKASWSALGGGHIVDIRYVDVHRVSHYVSKYLTKELLLSAPLRSRRVTTSRSLHLLQKSISDEKWTLFKVSIFFFYFRHSATASEIQLDTDGFLESFCVNTSEQPADFSGKTQRNVEQDGAWHLFFVFCVAKSSD